MEVLPGALIVSCTIRDGLGKCLCFFFFFPFFQIAKENLIKTDESLVLLPTNMLSVKIKMPKTFAYNVTIFQTQQSLCCYLQENTRTCTCNLMSKVSKMTLKACSNLKVLKVCPQVCLTSILACQAFWCSCFKQTICFTKISIGRYIWNF